MITGGFEQIIMAFDTIYAEASADVESLSAYARRFLGQMDLTWTTSRACRRYPSIRRASRNPRSTVATVTEVYDIEVLWAHVGQPRTRSAASQQPAVGGPDRGQPHEPPEA